MSWNSKYTYSWEYSTQNTHWSRKNYRATTLYYTKNASLGLCLSSNTHNGEKCICILLLGFSSFISWGRLPPVEGQGWQHLWGGPGWPHWRPFAPSITPVAFCPQTFSWEADIKRSRGCKDYWPGRCPCSLLILTFPEKSWDAFCMVFFCKARSKGRRHTYIFLLPSSPRVSSQRPGASQGHRSRKISGRTEDQLCTQRLFSMCQS